MTSREPRQPLKPCLSEILRISSKSSLLGERKYKGPNASITAYSRLRQPDILVKLVSAWSIRQHSERSSDLLVTASASYAYAIDLLLKVRVGFNYFTSDALEQMSTHPEATAKIALAICTILT